MIHRLLYPATVQGKVLHFALVAYLSILITFDDNKNVLDYTYQSLKY